MPESRQEAAPAMGSDMVRRQPLRGRAHTGWVVGAIAGAWMLTGTGELHAQASAAPAPVQAQAPAQTTVLQPMTVAQLLVTRSLELVYARDSVSIARALANWPQIIIADEPTGNLDQANGQIVIDYLTKLNRELNITLILITHDADVANKAPRILEIVDGALTDRKRA
jgi:ABC-type sulfate/molybdate transport systems ATPase subunit